MYMHDNSIIVSVPPQQLELIQLASRMGAQAAAKVAAQTRDGSNGLRQALLRAYATGYTTVFTRRTLAPWEIIYPIAARKAGYLVARYMRALRKARAAHAPAPQFTERPGQGRDEDLYCLMAAYGRSIRASGGYGQHNGHARRGGRTGTLTA